jgi:putative endonuclease
MLFWKQKDIIHVKPKTLGQRGEEWAQAEYKKQGYTIIAQNEYHHKGKRLGEIDFICRDSQTLIFVEVKTRTVGVDKFGTAAEAVNGVKQLKMLKAIKLYLLKHPELVSLRPQIDVCVIEVTNIDKSLYSATIIVNSVEDWN